jgi:hypothetical protein
VALSRASSPLIAHWGTVSHLQTQLTHRNHGIGSALMREIRLAPDDTRNEILMILTPL